MALQISGAQCPQKRRILSVPPIDVPDGLVITFIVKWSNERGHPSQGARMTDLTENTHKLGHIFHVVLTRR